MLYGLNSQIYYDNPAFYHLEVVLVHFNHQTNGKIKCFQYSKGLLFLEIEAFCG